MNQEEIKTKSLVELKKLAREAGINPMQKQPKLVAQLTKHFNKLIPAIPSNSSEESISTTKDPVGDQTTEKKVKVKVSRPGVHAKTKTSKIKTSKNYKKL